MRIQNYDVNLYGNHYDHEKTTFTKTKLEQQPTVEGNDKMQIELNQNLLVTNQIEGTEVVWEISEEDYQKMKLVEMIMSRLTGKKFKFILPARVNVDEDKYNGGVHLTVHQKPQNTQQLYQEIFTYQKKQSMELHAQGMIQTEDGREINFNFRMQEKREINYASARIVDQDGKVVDPLVINFDGKLPSLTDHKYYFDLDHDGQQDQISFLTKGSGFLAFDKNEDGKINDGRELFGPNSGNGFDDLREYDSDNNGWIDENDPIFDKLRIWSKDPWGQDHLIAIGERGIGAIYLGSVSTEFDLLGHDYMKDGEVKESGVFLYENGLAGSIHHLDIEV
jgi:hypothetical protein